ncbi:hypothetical protein COU49_02290 [Candidatus Nomurabacteria bacterium CG10_big_fil_rev_8_21_14_0_10_35_16]|uniref:DUF1190 domain-containing protein n=1 Tax=Candidatus Nomurabacteria bacterium CG10_big_fil_rev_8_21_14_0_10_35_16 TaxID=1974731 RepID=A0A2H0TAV7_9BACT|nr:MAG: hypothetical protein COU49_02290 [Candidatus Nomurabacteria bacterium CG10_big_fil_rev_8_21_14_0_10_35_16]
MKYLLTIHTKCDILLIVALREIPSGLHFEIGGAMSRLVIKKNEKFGILGVLIITGAALALAVMLLAGCGPSLPAVAMPSPILFGDATVCLTEAARILPATEAAQYCLEARRLEADRAEVAVVAASEAEQAKASQPSYYSSLGGYGAYGAMPVMRGGILYPGGSYNTVGGMMVRTGPSFVRSGGGGTNIIPRFSPPPRRR